MVELSGVLLLTMLYQFKVGSPRSIEGIGAVFDRAAEGDTEWGNMRRWGDKGGQGGVMGFDWLFRMKRLNFSQFFELHRLSPSLFLAQTMDPGQVENHGIECMTGVLAPSAASPKGFTVAVKAGRHIGVAVKVS